MLSAFNAHMSYIDANIEAGCSGDRLASLINSRVRSLCTFIPKAASVSMDEMSATLGALTASPHLSDDQREMVRAAIQTKCDQCEFGDDDKKTQHNDFFQKYLSLDITKIWMSEIDDMEKVRKTVRYNHGLGIVYPSPDLRKRIISLMLLYSKRTGGRYAHYLYKKYTEQNAAIRRKSRPEMTFRRFPEDPQDFRHAYPGRILTWVECGFEDKKIEDYMEMVSARNTNNNLKSYDDIEKGNSDQSQSQSLAISKRTSSCNQFPAIPDETMGVQGLMQQMLMKSMAQMFGMNMPCLSSGDRDRSRRRSRSPVEIKYGNGRRRSLTDANDKQGPPPQSSDDESEADIAACDNRDTDHETADRDERDNRDDRHRPAHGARDSTYRTEAESVEAQADANDEIAAEIKKAKLAALQTMTKPGDIETALTKAAIKQPSKSRKGQKRKATTSKTPSNGASPSTSGPSAASKTGKKKSKIEIAEFPKNKPPSFGAELPFIFNGCKVLKGSDRFRVIPRPGESVYDKAFQITAGKEKEAWASMIDYCKKPVIPISSKNYVK